MGRRAPPHPKIKYIIFQVGNYFEKYELRQNRISLISTNATQHQNQNNNPTLVERPSPSNINIPETPIIERSAPIEVPSLFSAEFWDEI